MRVAPGLELGQYRILSSLGAEGMGEAYRARNLQNQKVVVVKILPPHIGATSGAKTRFQEQLEMLHALAHPHILPFRVYGEDKEICFAVLELPPGETLLVRLFSWPLTWSHAARIGAEIAEGLAAAHGAGILHLDLKPESIYLLRDGPTVILDFALAATLPGGEQEPPAGRQGGAPFQPYRSPEQLSGKAADARSDIFALGCILFQMLTGKRPSSGQTLAEAMTPFSEEMLSPSSREEGKIPPLMTEVVRRCLRKEAQERFQSASDLAFVLRAIVSEVPPWVRTLKSPHFASPLWVTAWWILAVMLAFLLGSKFGDILSLN